MVNANASRFGRSPGLPVVHAELDGADASAIGDASNVVFTGMKNGPWRGQVDTRHRFYDRVLAPVPLAIPVDELTSHRPQADNPFSVFHTVAARHEQTGWIAVFPRQDFAVHFKREQRTRVHCNFQWHRAREFVGGEYSHEARL